MRETKSALYWTTTPERRYRDVVSPTSTLNEERMRDILSLAIDTLVVPGNENLILPPLKAFAPKRAEKQKHLHYHRYVEIGIVLQGEMPLWWDGSTSHCPAQSLFVIPPGTRYLPHAFVGEKTVPPHSVVWLALHRGNAVAHMCRLEGKTHLLSEYYRFTDTRIAGQARTLAQELADRSPHFETAVRGSLLCLLTWLLRAPIHSLSRQATGDSTARTTETDSLQQRIEDYLLTHYHRPVTLAQIARSMGCSPSYLCRYFRKQTGQTPFAYLLQVRMDAAKRLLDSDVPIARVAEMVGYDDPLYFSKVFSRHQGTSPQQFRIQQRQR